MRGWEGAIQTSLQSQQDVSTRPGPAYAGSFSLASAEPAQASSVDRRKPPSYVFLLTPSIAHSTWDCSLLVGHLRERALLASSGCLSLMTEGY